MSGFSVDWLTLRAGADDRARAPALLERVKVWAGDGPLLIADLGGGCGATRRALGSHLPAARWRLLDNDSALLDQAPPGADLETVAVDLAARPEAAFFPPDLVAASAFFDLVSAAWIDRFVALLAASRAPLYAALTYDGREDWRPAPRHEAAALEAFRGDMARDKGFGPALGPNAPRYLADALRRSGYTVHEAASDWRLTRARDAALIESLATGAATAARVRAALSPAALRDWRTDRTAATAVVIGHCDILAFPGSAS